MNKTILFEFRAPKQPMTRPYVHVLILRTELVGKNDLKHTYNVTTKYNDEAGGQGPGFYTVDFNEALAAFNKKVARDVKFFSSEWKRSFKELGLLPGV